MSYITVRDSAVAAFVGMRVSCGRPAFSRMRLLVFPDGFTELDEWAMQRKGFVYAFLECEDGCRYQVMFIDPVRLAQDIEATLQSGQPYYYEFGQVVVPEVTIAAITQTIPLLVEEGYLERHLPEREPAAR